MDSSVFILNKFIVEMYCAIALFYCEISTIAKLATLHELRDSSILSVKNHATSSSSIKHSLPFRSSLNILYPVLDSPSKPDIRRKNHPNKAVVV